MNTNVAQTLRSFVTDEQEDDTAAELDAAVERSDLPIDNAAVVPWRRELPAEGVEAQRPLSTTLRHPPFEFTEQLRPSPATATAG